MLNTSDYIEKRASFKLIKTCILDSNIPFLSKQKQKTFKLIHYLIYINITVIKNDVDTNSKNQDYKLAQSQNLMDLYQEIKDFHKILDEKISKKFSQQKYDKECKTIQQITSSYIDITINEENDHKLKC